MKKFLKSKKGVSVLVTLVVVIGASVAAYAYFVAPGAGTGTANTAHPSNLLIQPVGAGYDSLIPITDGGYPGGYIQDQCENNCTSITSLGNQVDVAGGSTQVERLVSVVVAFRNHGGAINDGNPANAVPITVTVNGHSVTSNPPIHASNATTGRPWVTEATFDFSGTPVFIQDPVTYSISYDVGNSAPAASGLNVALSNSSDDITAGGDTGNFIWLSSNGSLAGGENDFPTCVGAGPGATFGPFTDTRCGHSNPQNPYAYGTASDIAGGNADIPAAEINVLGAPVPDLSPGVSQPVNFAIQNPGTTSVHVTSVSSSVSGVSGGTGNCVADATTGGSAPWYITTSTPVAVNETIPPGITVFPATGTQVKMVDTNTDQTECAGASVALAFSSN